MTSKNIHKIFIFPKIFIFLKTPKNIEIQNFEPKKMTRAYVCIKISEYPLGFGRPSIKISQYRDQTCFSMHKHLLDLEGGVEPSRDLVDVSVSKDHVWSLLLH